MRYAIGDLLQLPHAIRLTLYAICLTAMTLLAGCPKPIAVWLPPESTGANLAFRIGNRHGSHKVNQFVTFLVRPCHSEERPENALWLLYLSDFSIKPYPTTVVYGQVPKGYREETPAQPLPAGCYIASADGASAWFAIRENGTVTVPARR